MVGAIACEYFCFFNDTATTEIYTLSLHDALPIFGHHRAQLREQAVRAGRRDGLGGHARDHVDEFAHDGVFEHERLRLLRRTTDRKSTRLNSSHANTSYAVFCLKNKNKSHNHSSTT